jgi:hypothetical protein
MKKHIVIFTVILMVTFVITSVAGCKQKPEPSPPPPASSPLVTAKPAAVSGEEDWITKPEYFVPNAETAVIGRVTEGLPPIEIDNAVYRDWVFEVESYVFNPLPETSLKVRIHERTGMMPVKGVHLAEGEHLLLFLNSEDDHFIMLGGLMGAKYIIDDGRIRYGMYADSPWEPLDETVARIKAVAETWADEELTPERENELTEVAMNHPEISEYLAGRSYETRVGPYTRGVAPGVIRYLVSFIFRGEDEVSQDLRLVVNATEQRVEDIIFTIIDHTLTEEEESQTLQIALADETVKEVMGGRSYKESPGIIRDGWYETVDGKVHFYIFPKVELWLQPTVSDILEIYVDLDREKVVKIFTESHLSPMPLRSSETDRDFTLTIEIPATDYRVGETAEATLTMSYHGEEPVEITAPGSQYLNLTIRDGQGNIIYNWERQEFGPPPTALDWYKETLQPGQAITKCLEFSVPQAGTFYLEGRNFGGWDYGQVLVDYPDGHGYGLYMETPYILITASGKSTPDVMPSEGSHPEGMESIRWLTDEEKDKVIEIALNTPEATDMSKEYGVNKTGISWVAIEWQNGVSMHGFDYEMVSKVPDNVPETAEFYSRVEIYFGEPERVLMEVAVNPDTCKVARIITHPLKRLP